MDDVIEKVQRVVERRLANVRMYRWSWDTGPVFVGTDRGSGELKYAYKDNFFGELMIVSRRVVDISVCHRADFSASLGLDAKMCRCCTRVEYGVSVYSRKDCFFFGNGLVSTVQSRLESRRGLNPFAESGEDTPCSSDACVGSPRTAVGRAARGAHVHQG